MDKKWAEGVLAQLDEKLSKVAVRSYDKIPYTTINGVHDDKSSSKSWWTNGFWPAMMILMYSITKNEQYLKTGRHTMDMMDEALYTFDDLHHDVGFMWNISSGADYRLTGDKKERNRMLIAANHLMGRFNHDAEFIRAWNHQNTKSLAIIDCMMNIPLLFRASKEVDDERYAMVARVHANKTMKYHVRDNGSCNHINSYDPLTGEFLGEQPGQGYGVGTAWSRGQSWALYGFALAAYHDNSKAYLDTAKKVAEYFIKESEKTDWLPRCDFMQPDDREVYDSTAGGCAACGLLLLADLTDGADKARYQEAGEKLLKALYNKCANFDENVDHIIEMGTERYGNNEHMPIIYGDYFFIEGVARLAGKDVSFVW